MKSVIRMTERGFTLIEILVALLILAIGLLGLAGLQTRAQQAEMESYQRAQALVLVEDMANRLKANSAFADCYNGNLGTGQSAPAGCNTQADTDLAAWHNLLLGAAEQLSDGAQVGAMIGARGCITKAGNSYTISVAWQGLMKTIDPGNGACGGGYGEGLHRQVNTTVLISDLGT